MCEEARLNKRYFYESFQDLDQLVGAVVDDIASRLLLVGQQAAEDSLAEQLDTDALARRVLDAIVDWLVEDRRRAEVLFSTVSDHPGALVHRSAVVSMLAAGLSAFAADYHGAPGPIALASIGSALLVGGTVDVLARWMRGDLDVEQEQLVEHLAGLWVAVGDHAVRSARVLDGRREASTS